MFLTLWMLRLSLKFGATHCSKDYAEQLIIIIYRLSRCAWKHAAGLTRLLHICLIVAFARGIVASSTWFMMMGKHSIMQHILILHSLLRVRLFIKATLPSSVILSLTSTMLKGTPNLFLYFWTKNNRLRVDRKTIRHVKYSTSAENFKF